MRRNLFALFVALAFPFAVAASEFHALLIANSDYQRNDHWADLQTPERDVTALDRILSDQYGFETHILRNATRSQIIDEIEAIKNVLDDDDSLLIYFAGHGILREGDGGYWVGTDATSTSRAGWLKYDVIDDLIDYRAGMRARHVLVVADSCYSGAALRSRNDFAENPDTARADLLNRRYSQRSRTVLTSGGTEPVLDSVGSSQHSVFATELIDKLASNTAIVDTHSLYRQIEPEVFGRARRVLGERAQAPEYGALDGVGHDGGDFLFIPVGMKLPEPGMTPTPSPSDFGLRGPTRIVHERPGMLHIGDEPISNWAPLHGSCYEIAFDYRERIESLQLTYDVFGAENTFVAFNGIIYDFESMIPPAGRKRPNYWVANRQMTLPVGQTFSSPVRLRICSRLIDNPDPEMPHDLDDFQLRNIRLQVN